MLAGITIAQWIAIASILIKAAPEVRKAFVLLHPVLQKILHDAETALAGGASGRDAATTAGEQAHRYANQGGPRTHGGHQDI